MGRQINIETEGYDIIDSVDALQQRVEEGDLSIRISLPRPINQDRDLKELFAAAYDVAQTGEANYDLRQARIDLVDIIAAAQNMSDEEIEQIGEGAYRVFMMPIYSSIEKATENLGQWIDEDLIYEWATEGLGNQARRMAQDMLDGDSDIPIQMDSYVIFAERLPQNPNTKGFQESRIMGVVTPDFQQGAITNDFLVQCSDELAAELILPKMYDQAQIINSRE